MPPERHVILACVCDNAVHFAADGIIVEPAKPEVLQEFLLIYPILSSQYQNIPNK